MKLGLILLASGAGSRFGANKLLAYLEGRTVAERTMDAYPPGLFQRAIVVSRYPEILALAETRGYTALFNEQADEGISASIRIGVARMADMDGVLFAVCDQPWLTRESVERAIAAFTDQPGKIAALSWEGEKGNPCLFPARFFGELSALTGDRGGGAVIRAHPEALLLVAARFERELRDIDCPTDLDV